MSSLQELLLLMWWIGVRYWITPNQCQQICCMCKLILWCWHHCTQSNQCYLAFMVFLFDWANVWNGTVKRCSSFPAHSSLGSKSIGFDLSAMVLLFIRLFFLAMTGKFEYELSAKRFLLHVCCKKSTCHKAIPPDNIWEWCCYLWLHEHGDSQVRSGVEIFFLRLLVVARGLEKK